MKTKFMPVEVDDVTMAFPASVIGKYLPPIEEIPERFKRHDATDMHRLVSRWFYEGLIGSTSFDLREGVDKRLALRHLAACLGSFEPKHEHKEAGCAYLCALWFKRVQVGTDVYISDEPT